MEQRPLNHSTESEIKREQLKLLYAPLRASQFTVLVNALFILFILRDVIAQPILISWFVALLATIFYRLFVRFQFNQIADNRFSPAMWERKFLFGVILSAVAWGVGAIVLFAPNSITHQVFLAFIFAGITAGSISTLSPSFRAILIFLVLSLIPLGLRLLLTDTILGISMGSLVFLYTLMLVVSGKRFHQNIVENIQLRYEAQRSEKKLHESEEKYRLLFEKSEDPMWLISGNKFTMANQAALNLLGYATEEELANTHPSELSPPLQGDGTPSLEKAEEMMRIGYETGYNRFEWTHKKRNGELFPVAVTLTRIPSEGEDAIFCTWRDISAQKETERALIEAKEAADVANQSKSAFLASMSHEIRTPIHGVLGMTQLLQGTELNPQQQEYLNTIRVSGNSLLTIINEILDLSKIEAGELQIESHPFDLPHAVDDLYRLLSPKAREKGLNLDIDIDDGVPVHVLGDAHRICQILTNLIGNAIKFTEHGGITIKINTSSSVGENYSIRFEVIDSGIGIAVDSQEALFQPFTQADNSTARKYGGTGLGLAISKRLVNLMGGEMGVESIPEQGSTFWFTLTLAASTEAKSGAEEPSSDSTTAPQLEGTILMAEDNEINVMILTSMLKESDLQIDIAENGEQALKMYRQKPYDLILMDCQMPVMDGYQATAEIRNNENAGAHIPIIAITASASEEDRQQTIDAGMDDFMSKPFNKEPLLQILSKWLNREE